MKKLLNYLINQRQKYSIEVMALSCFIAGTLFGMVIMLGILISMVPA